MTDGALPHAACYMEMREERSTPRARHSLDTYADRRDPPKGRAVRSLSPARGTWIGLREQAAEAVGHAPPAAASAKGNLNARAATEIAERLRGFLALGDGWAGEGTSAPTSALCQWANKHFQSVLMVLNALDVTLPPPWLAISDDGAIGAEWLFNGRELTITFEAPGSADYFGRADGTELEGEVSEHDATAMIRHITWLATGKLV